MNRQLSYRPDVDGLRTIAVVPVVLFHAGLGFPGGFVGVDVFFVISGFLITTILQREIEAGEFSLLGFYERRARRILPALFAVIAACLVAGWFLMLPDAYEQLAGSAVSALVFVSNMWFWQNSGGYFAGPTDYLPLLHTWSLAVEEQFYIFFPLILIGLNRLGRRGVLPVLLLLVAGSFALAAWATPRSPSASFYLIVTRAWELGFGSLIALGALPARLGTAPREGFALLGLAGIVVPIFAYSGTTTFPGLAALPVVAGTAMLLWTGGTGPTLVTRLLSLRPMVAIGLISYSLYLWHWPVMAFARVRLFSAELPLNWQIATVTVSFLLAWASWRFVERPFRKPARAGGPSRAAIFTSSLAGIVLLGCGAASVVWTKGALETRFSAKEIADYGSVSKSFDFGKCEGVRPLQELCHFNTDAAKSGQAYLLFGDSHANRLLPALVNVAAEQGREVIFANKGACLPLPGTSRNDMALPENEHCARFRETIIKHALEDPSISTLMITARWSLYDRGKKTPSEGGARFRLGSDELPRSTPNPQVMQRSLEKLAARISAAGKRLILVGDVPEMPWNVPQRLQSEILVGAAPPEAVDVAQVMARQGRVNTLLAKIAEDNANTSFIDMIGAICESTCPSHDGLTSFYSDNDHMSLAGSRALALPALRAALIPPGSYATELPSGG